MAIGRLIIPSNDPDTPQRVIELRTAFFNQQVTVTPVPPALGDPVVVPPGTTTGPTQEEADDAAEEQGGNGIPPLFGNEEQTATCPAGRTGSPSVIAAGAYTASTLAAANALALSAAVAALNCTYLNTEQTAVCAAGKTGSSVTVAAGLFSASTQAAADALALADGQSRLSCMFLNERQTYVANCGPGFTGTPVTVAKDPSSTYAAATQNAANALALGAAQSEANSQLLCVPVVVPHPPVITSALTKSGTQGVALTYQIAATNSPTSFGATGLPTGLSVNILTGVISGTPLVSGPFNVTIVAANNDGQDVKTLVLTLAAVPIPPVVTSAGTATPQQGIAFSYQITASNHPTSFGASGLPAGLSVNSGTGVISGIPTVNGQIDVMISASNIDGTGSKTLSLDILPPAPVITSSLFATGQQNTGFSYQIAASNSPTSYAASGLPAGISINTVTGLISGIPTGSGNVSVSISAINRGGTNTKTLAIAIAVAPPPPPPPPDPEPLPQGVRFATTHVQLDLGQYNFGVRALSEIVVEAQELKTANLIPIIYADDFGQSGIATLYDLWLTALESIGWKMIPGFRGFQSPAWKQWIIDRKNRAGMFRNSQGQLVISGFFTAWDLDQVNDWRALPSRGDLKTLRDAGIDVAYYPDPPFSGTQSYAFRAKAIGAAGTALFFPPAPSPIDKGTNTIAEYMGVVAEEKAAADNYGIDFMQPIMPCGFVAAPSANFRMLDLYGWDGVFVQFEFARQRNIRCIELITWRDFVEHTYLGKFRNGETVVGTPSAPFVSGMLILDHSGIAKYCRRHVQWFLTGVEPAITEDEVLVMTRLHPRKAKSYDDMTPAEKNAVSAWFPPESTTMGNSGLTSAQELSRDFKLIYDHEVMDDAVGVCTWLTVPTRVDVTVGSNKTSYNCPGGETRLVVPGNAIDQSPGGPKHRFTSDQFGLIKVEMFRNNVKFFEAQTPVAIQESIIPGGFNLWSAQVVPTTLEYFVATTGSDSNPGTESQPFATVSKARDVLRAATGRTTVAADPPGNWGGASVYLGTGIHVQLQALTFDGRDTATEAFPTVYRAKAGATPILSIGKAIAQGPWSAVTSGDAFAWAKLPTQTRAATYKMSLSGLGIADLGSLGDNKTWNRLELLVGGSRRRMATYPSAPTNWMVASSVVDADSIAIADSHLNGYSLTGQSPIADTFSQFEFWPRRVDVTSIASGSPAQVNISGFIGSGGFNLQSGENKIRTKLINCLEDLSVPGTYVLALAQNAIYYLPEAGAGAPSDAQLTVLPTLIHAAAVNHIHFDGIILEGARTKLVKAVNCTGIQFDNCAFRNFGGFALWFGDEFSGWFVYADQIMTGACYDSGARNCSFANGGAGALFGRSGDRVNLISGGCYLDACTISEVGDVRNLWAIIKLWGCGWDISRLDAGDVNTDAIELVGNRIHIDSCQFSRFSRILGDAGVCYQGKLHTYQENVVSNCRGIDCGSVGGIVAPHYRSTCFFVYGDDGTSDLTARDNVVINSNIDFGCNGFVFTGRRTTFVGNKWTNCHGIDQVKGDEAISGSNRVGGDASDILYDLGNIEGSGKSVLQEPWASAYPWLAQDLADGGALLNPTGCIIRDNESTTARSDGVTPSESNPAFPNAKIIATLPNAMRPFLDLNAVNKGPDGVLTPLRYQYRP